VRAQATAQTAHLLDARTGQGRIHETLSCFVRKGLALRDGC
jgi:hypothetical protein